MAHSPRGWGLQDQGNITFSLYGGSHWVYTLDPSQFIQWIHSVYTVDPSQFIQRIPFSLYSGSHSVYTVDHSQFIQWITFSIYSGSQSVYTVDPSQLYSGSQSVYMVDSSFFVLTVIQTQASPLESLWSGHQSHCQHLPDLLLTPRNQWLHHTGGQGST